MSAVLGDREPRDPFPALTVEESIAALELVDQNDRNWIFTLPPGEAVRVIEALVAFPGAVFAKEPE